MDSIASKRRQFNIQGLSCPPTWAGDDCVSGAPALPGGAPSQGAPGGPATGGAVSLDTRGTSRQIERDTARWARRGREHRDLVASLEALGRQTDADKVRSCGRLMVYSCGDCGALSGRSNLSCDNRLCSYCSHVRAEKMAHKLVPIVEQFRNPVFMVLTVKNGDDLAERDEHLRSGMKKLQRRVAWRRAFRGGFVFEEVTHTLAGWHPHLNVLADGYMAQAELAELWRSCTGDSFIVHVQYIAPEDRLKGIYEACKYAAKPSDLVDRPELVGEFLDHFKGRRMTWAFGDQVGAMSRVEEEIAEEIADELAPAEACPACQSGHLVLVPHLSWSKCDCRPVGGGWWSSTPSPPGGPPARK